MMVCDIHSGYDRGIFRSITDVSRSCFQNLSRTKIGQIYVAYKFAQNGCIPPKIKYEILAHKGLQKTSATPGDYLAF